MQQFLIEFEASVEDFGAFQECAMSSVLSSASSMGLYSDAISDSMSRQPNVKAGCCS